MMDNYKLIIFPSNTEGALMVYAKQIGGSDRMPTSLESLCIQLDDKAQNLEKERDELKAQIKRRNKTLKTMMETVGDCNEDSKNMTVDWKMGAIWVYQNIECAIEDARNEMRDKK